MLDEHLHAKIGDFGFAQDKFPIYEDLGSRIYRAPEICKKHFPYDGEKADVFALAFVLFAMRMKLFPVETEDKNKNEIFNIIETKKYNSFAQKDWVDFWPTDPKVSNEFKKLFIDMFEEDPSKRINLS